MHSRLFFLLAMIQAQGAFTKRQEELKPDFELGEQAPCTERICVAGPKTAYVGCACKCQDGPVGGCVPRFESDDFVTHCDIVQNECRNDLQNSTQALIQAQVAFTKREEEIKPDVELGDQAACTERICVAGPKTAYVGCACKCQDGPVGGCVPRFESEDFVTHCDIIQNECRSNLQNSTTALIQAQGASTQRHNVIVGDDGHKVAKRSREILHAERPSALSEFARMVTLEKVSCDTDENCRFGRSCCQDFHCGYLCR
jgi:hypothetical protein